MKYQIGDKVRVVANEFDHPFPNRAIVKIVDWDEDEDPCYKVSLGRTVYWLKEDELAPVDEAQTDIFSEHALLLLAGKMAMAAHGALRSNVLSLSSRMEALDQALSEYDNAILHNAKKK